MKRPDCETCGEEEAAMMIIAGKMLCGHCVEAFVKFEQKKRQEEMIAFINERNANKNMQ